MPIGEFKVKFQGTVSKVKDDHIGQLKQSLDTPRQLQLRSRTIACTPSSKKKMVTPARKYGTVGSKQNEESAIKPRLNNKLPANVRSNELGVAYQ